jgi:hypothetical protein
MIKGSCLCGGVQFEVDEILLLTHCHCANCRKLTGAAFGTYAHVQRKHFRYLKGTDLIAQYESAPGSYRQFCKICSSTVPGQADYLPTISIPAGLFDDDPGVRPALHTFVRSKAPWWEITDELPQYEKWVPGYEPKNRS